MLQTAIDAALDPWHSRTGLIVALGIVAATLIIALDFEDSEHAKRLRSDFIMSLNDLVTDPQRAEQFSFVELRPSIARRIRNPDDADWFARRCNLHFLLWGRARLRPLPQGPGHVIDLRGWVRHAHIEGKACMSSDITFCSHLAMRGAPARAIQELAGHQEISTTQRYMHLSPAVLDAAIRLLESPTVTCRRGEILETPTVGIGNSRS